MTCRAGASWLQEEILNRYPAAPVKVYAVWLNVLTSDSRAAWDERLLTDARVVHLWDEKRVTGDWFAKKVSNAWAVEWDVFFLYGPGSRWEGDREPTEFESRGRTILARRALLVSTLAPYLNPAGEMPAFDDTVDDEF